MKAPTLIIILSIVANVLLGQNLSASHTWMNPDNMEMTLEVLVDLEANEATITMTGPENEWFAYGFGQSQMSGTYALIAEKIAENTVVSERMLAFHAAGTELSSNRLSTEMSTNEGVRTVIVKVPASGLDAYYDFPSAPQNISFISAVGFGGSLEFHGGENYTLGNENNNLSALAFSSVVPVTWSRIALTSEGTNAILKWETSSEINNEGFYVQRSQNGKEWNSLGFINGESERGGEYEFIDEGTLPGVNYYRLKQVDHDGSENFSEIKSIEIRGSEVVDDIILFPNPVKDQLFIEKKKEDGPARVQIFDMNYRLVSDMLWETEGGHQKVDVSEFQAGHYLVMIKHKAWGHTTHFVKQ